MKKLSLLSAAFMIVSLLCGNVFSAKAAEEPIHLSLASLYPDRHLTVVEVYKPWIEEVKQRSNGRLIIDFYNPNTLCPATEVLSSLQKGQISMGFGLVTMNPGRLPANTVINYVCLRYTDAYTSTMAYNEIVKKYPQLLEEFKDIKILALHTSAPQQMHMDKFPINTLEDLKGHKFLSSSADGTRLLKALGASAIMQPNMDMYLSLSRGMAEGCMQPFAPLRSYKLDECTKFHSIMGLYSTPMWLGMNQKTYDSLPKDLQQIIDETTVDLSERIGASLKKADFVEVETMKSKGHVFNNIATEELDKMRAIIDPVAREVFLDEMKKRSKIKIDAEQIYNDALNMVDEMNAKYSQKQVM